jgi:hypothetical protein
VAPARVPLDAMKESTFDLLSSVVSNNEDNPPFVLLESPKSGLKASFDTNRE